MTIYDNESEEVNISESFDAYVKGLTEIEDLDTDIWCAILDATGESVDDYKKLPRSVQLFYASRYLEWEVANGGFPQAAYNIPGLFALAREWYSMEGLNEAASIIEQAEQLIRDGEAEFKTPCGGDIGELFEEFLDSRLSALSSPAWECGLDATEARVKYAIRNRGDFESIVKLP